MPILISSNTYPGYETEYEQRLDAVSGDDASIHVGEITAAALTGVSVFVLILPQTPLTASEITALVDFVNDGGRLLLFADHDFFEGSSNSYLDSVLSALGAGIETTGGAFLDDPVVLSGHAINDGLAPFTMQASGALAVTGGAEVLATAAGSPVAAFEQIGSGEVFVFSDIDLFFGLDGDGSASSAYLERITEYEFAPESAITDAIVFKYGPSADVAENAAVGLGLTTTSYDIGADDAAFIAALAAADPATTILIVDTPSTQPSQATIDAMIAFISSGGHVIMSYWNLDAHPDLQAALDVATTGEIFTPETVQDGAPSDIFNGLGTEITFDSDNWADNGDRLNAVDGAIVEATFSGGGGAIVIGNGGRTIVNAFLYDDMGDDPQQLIANEIEHIMAAAANDDPELTGPVTSTATEDDAAYPVDLLAGASDADGDTLTATGVTHTGGDDVGITIDGNELDVDPNAYNHLAAGESEVVTYSYTIDDGNGGTVAQTATVTIEGVNDGPDAVDDVLGGSGGGVLRVGYYDMEAGQGVAAQVASIEAAGHIAVLITDLSDAELADIDMLVVQNPDNFGYSAEYLARASAINTAVENGMTLIIHDRHVDGAESILPGSGGFSIVRDFTDDDEVNFIDDAHSVADGPGGALDDLSLDGGTSSTHGFAIAGTLPAGADLILSTNSADQVVTFSYAHGDGNVIYSSIPLDFYLAFIAAGIDNGDGIWDSADNYATNLIDYAASDLEEPALADEDTIEIIQTADLLANDTDPDTTDVLTVSGVSATSTLGAGVTLNGDGTISYDPTAALNHLAEGEVVEDSFTYTISDGNGGTDTATVTFSVVGINDAPSAPVDGDGPTGAAISEHLAVGEEIGIDADSTDPEGDAIEYFFRDGDGNRTQSLGGFTINALTGVVTLAAAVNYELDTQHMITVYASDGSDESSTTFTVDVLNEVEHLFTPEGDGTALDPIDFNNLPDGAYDYDGAQYNALAGDDYVILPDLATAALPGHAWDYTRTFVAGAGNDVIQGGDGNDAITGSEGDDSLFGRDGDDRLVGSSGDDILAGGDGSDKLTGSEGRDIFIFTDSEIGTTKDGEHDTITDFQQRTDRIDISALYAPGAFKGVEAGALDGTTGDGYQVGYYYEAGKTWVEGDTNGDGVADFVIELNGKFKLGSKDFLVASEAFIKTADEWNDQTDMLDYGRYHQDAFWI